MYGYRIENGKPEIDPMQASRLQVFFKLYISGMGLERAASNAMIGECLSHASAKRILMNRRYLGESGYPRIITEELFGQAQAEINSRAAKRAAKHLTSPETAIEPAQPAVFIMRQPAKIYDDPATQAEYLYSLIEREVQ